MQEYSAAAARNARPSVVVDFDNEIIEAIGTPQPVAWFIGRPVEGPVVPSIGRIFAPGVVGPDPPDRQQGARPRQAVGSPPQPNRMKLAGRRRAVAFPLGRFDAGPAQCRPYRAMSRRHPALRAPLRAGADMDCGKMDRGKMDRGKRALAHRATVPAHHLPSRLSRAQSLQFKPSVALTFCPHIIFSGMVSALADHALVLLIVSLRAQWRAKGAGGLKINAEYAQDSHCR